MGPSIKEVVLPFLREQGSAELACILRPSHLDSKKPARLRMLHMYLDCGTTAVEIKSTESTVKVPSERLVGDDFGPICLWFSLVI